MLVGNLDLPADRWPEQDGHHTVCAGGPGNGAGIAINQHARRLGRTSDRNH